MSEYNVEYKIVSCIPNHKETRYVKSRMTGDKVVELSSILAAADLEFITVRRVVEKATAGNTNKAKPAPTKTEVKP